MRKDDDARSVGSTLSIATRGARGGRRRPRWIKRLPSIPPPANTPKRNKCSSRLRRSTGSWGLVRVDDRVDGRCDATQRSSFESQSHRPGIARSLRSRDREIGRPRRRPSSRARARREDQRKKNTECEKTLRGRAPETQRRRRHGAKMSRSTPRTRRSRSKSSCRSKTGSKFERERTCERSPGPPPYRRHSSNIGSPGSSSRTGW
jgi:hypothetical protein